MFDLTKEIKLDPKWEKAYAFSRVFIYFSAILGVLYVSYLVLFPASYFSYSFVPSKEKDTIYDLSDSTGGFPAGGKVSPEDKLNFFTFATGRFSKVDLDVETGKNPINEAKIAVQKSYRAFFYPLGEPLGFKDGSLVKSENDYFIISRGELRKFTSPETAEKMGFNPDAFFTAEKKDIAFNKIGENILFSEYPEDSVFKINGDCYILQEGKLEKFVSHRAYLSNYADGVAVTKDENFLQNYEISNELAGFSDGTLVSFEGSVYVISEMIAFPIQDPAVFESLGFKWENVIPAKSEEIGIYTKEKALNLNKPHPNGIIMADEKAEKYFYIQDGMKREIGSGVIANSYNRGSFVSIRVSGINADVACISRRGFFNNYGASCQADIRNLANTPGITYKFGLSVSPETKIGGISATFKQSVNVENLKISLGVIKNKIIARFYGKK